MLEQSKETRTAVVSMTIAGFSAAVIAGKIGVADRTVRRHRRATKVPGVSGRPPVAVETATGVGVLARAGHGRKEIARQLNLSQPTVTKILRAAGIYLPRGGDRRSKEARAARREAPGGLYDKRIDVDTAAAWAGSGYKHGQLAAAWHGQKELPRTLSKKINLL